MKRLDRSCISTTERPLKILQFGGGNFLRAFLGWMVQILNEETGFNGNIAVVKPTSQGSYDTLRDQEGVYQVLLRGTKGRSLVTELKLIDSVGRIINPYREWEDYLKLAEIRELKLLVSNTTEAGIRFDPEAGPDRAPENFPAKLTLWLHHRFMHFNGQAEAGCIVLPCELIEDNGSKLKECILQYARLWQLADDFPAWVENANIFCNTLVDRIVSGYPGELSDSISEQTGWKDGLLVAAEHYHSWVIEGPPSSLDFLPTRQTSLNVSIVHDLTPFRELKVRILNGTHTLMVPVGCLLGLRYVQDCVEDELMKRFISGLQEEISSTIGLPPGVVSDYCKQVIARFGNPYIRHALTSIALNAISKFRSRVLPTILSYTNTNRKLPPNIILAFAALIRFYKGDFPLKEDRGIITLFNGFWAGYDHTPKGAYDLAARVLACKELWGANLDEIGNFAVLLGNYLFEITENGIRRPLEAIN